MSSERVRHGKEDEDTAYRLQVMGAREGIIKGGLVGAAVVSFANWRFPWVQRQTLAGKVFLASWFAIFGFVTHADHYLLQWEARHRAASEQWRTKARAELAAQGTVPSETAMRQWKAQWDQELQSKRDAAAAARKEQVELDPSDVALAAMEGQGVAPKTSTVMNELQKNKEKAQIPGEVPVAQP